MKIIKISDHIPKRKILLYGSIDDNTKIFEDLAANNWEVFITDDLNQALKLYSEHNFKVGLCLFNLEGKQSITTEISALLTSTFYFINWVMCLSKEINSELMVQSDIYKLIAQFCYNYITLPETSERLMYTLGHAYGMNELFLHFKNQISNDQFQLGIIGNCPAIQHLRKQIQKSASEDCSVLIQGETGTGKELIAKAIHELTHGDSVPFIAINCGAFPSSLIQAELFGYEKGAFTGALSQKIGCIEAAQGGTLFLDEIGDLQFDQQVNLLRFLEDRTIVRIGGLVTIPVDTRVIAATHVDLKVAVAEGKFREDLYYRLRILQVSSPPLRDREGDIELLSSYFFDKFSKTKKYKAKGFHPDALYLMKRYYWPGNVRELMNCIRGAMVMSDNRLLTPYDLGLDRRSHKDRAVLTLEESRAISDRDSIITALRLNNNNLTHAADALNISRVSLYRLMEKYNLKNPHSIDLIQDLDHS